MTAFFQKLPTISYNGVPSKNLLVRARLSDETLASKTSFYPYIMTDGDRIDVLSHKYYEDSDYAWLIWMTNNVIDPYYDLYMNETEFQNFIVTKYGNISNAQSTIAYYSNSWISDESELSITTYESLPSGRKKYFSPITDYNNTIIGYTRKREDWIVNTNRTVLSTCISTSSFTENEKVTQSYISNNSVIGTGVVVHSNTSHLSMQHITGEFLATNTAIVTGNISTSNAVLTSVYVNQNIPEAEEAYWDPVSNYDHEQLVNEQKKHIKLLDKIYRTDAEYELRKVLSE